MAVEAELHETRDKRELSVGSLQRLIASEISVGALIDTARRNWAFLLTGAAVGFLLTFLLLLRSTPVYTVSIRTVPAQSGGQQSALGAIVQGTGLSALVGTSMEGSFFGRYKKLLSSPTLARRLAERHGVLRTIYASHWDKDKQEFRTIKSLTGRIYSPIYWALGLDPFSRPSPNSLAAMLRNRVKLTESLDDDTLLLSLDWPDPEYAKSLLTWINLEANQILREQGQAKAEQILEFLRERLDEVKNTDHRQTLLQILLEQERALILSRSRSAFAAEVLEPPTASDNPTSPRPKRTLPVGTLLGLIISYLLLLVRDATRTTPETTVATSV